jgi:hypothetical protein
MTPTYPDVPGAAGPRFSQCDEPLSNCSERAERRWLPQVLAVARNVYV